MPHYTMKLSGYTYVLYTTYRDIPYTCWVFGDKGEIRNIYIGNKLKPNDPVSACFVDYTIKEEEANDYITKLVLSKNYDFIDFS
jgi:hypothetical protein